MNLEIGTETPIFLFWEYLFRNFGVLSLQCTPGKVATCQHRENKDHDIGKEGIPYEAV
jgi:hypothetical protein